MAQCLSAPASVQDLTRLNSIRQDWTLYSDTQSSKLCHAATSMQPHSCKMIASSTSLASSASAVF